jgi:hypothetical protein
MVGEATLATGAGLGVELVDEVDDVEEAAAGTAADAGAGDADSQVGLAGARRSGVILPGVWRLKFGSSTRFIRAAARRLWPLVQSATRAPST